METMCVPRYECMSLYTIISHIARIIEMGHVPGTEEFRRIVSEKAGKPWPVEYYWKECNEDRCEIEYGISSSNSYESGTINIFRKNGYYEIDGRSTTTATEYEILCPYGIPDCYGDEYTITYECSGSETASIPSSNSK